MISLIAEREGAIRDLCVRHQVRQLDVFGSAARDDFASASDIDFLVDFEPMPPIAYADAYFALLEGLEALFGRPIDLVTEATVVNPYFKAGVQASRECVYAR